VEPAPRGKGRAAVYAAVALALAVAGIFLYSQYGRGGAEPAAAADQVGYRLDGKSVVFDFFPEEFDAVRLADGRLDRLTSMGVVRSVQVAGAFNGWGNEPGNWNLKRDRDGTFRLRLPTKLFASRHVWPFKFVVNGNIWVGAPAHAANRELAVTDMATYTSGYYYTFTYVPANLRIANLEPLRGIPLAGLDLGATKVTDFTPLRDARTLVKVMMNDDAYYHMTGGFRDALDQRDYNAALAMAQKAFADFTNVPALSKAHKLLAGGIENMRSLEADPASVPPDALSHAGHRYGYVPLPMTWTDARAYAAAAGGHLVSVQDEEENVWLVTAFGQPSLGRRLWLGGTDERSEGYWRWDDAERWLYENWTKPEPDNGGNAEHHLAMKSDGWWTDDNGGSVRLPFVIEWNR
jgi:hypothetical protein